MSSANVLSSAPPKGIEEQQYTPRYPNLPATNDAETFQLTEIRKIEKQISNDRVFINFSIKREPDVE